MITIRPIQATDDNILAKLIRSVFEEHGAPRDGTVYSDPTTDHLSIHFQTSGAILWVALSDEEILGCCGIYPTTGLPKVCGELVKFYLSKNARGKGVGKALMEKSIASAKELGYRQIYLESLPEFSNAVSIYEKQGFRRLADPLGDSGHTGCTIWMLKDLEN